MKCEITVALVLLFIVGVLTPFMVPETRADLELSTVVFDHFDSDTIATGYWEYNHTGGSYEISDSRLRLYMTSEGLYNNSGIIRAIPLGQNMTITARALGSTLYRFAVTWWLSDRFVNLEFDDLGFCVTTTILPTRTWGWIGQFGPSPAANTSYVLSLEVKPTPFTIKSSVYDDNNNLLGTLSSDLGWNYSDIEMASVAVWSDAPPCPLSDYYVDWVKVTGYYQDTTPPVISILSPENKTYTVNNVSLTFSVNEPTSWIGYSLDDQANVTITGSTTLNTLSEGLHRIIVYAKDTSGNSGKSETIYFSISAPQLGQSEPFPIWIIIAIVIIVLGVITLLVYFTRVRKTTKKAR
jgi:hypothetical protein